MASGQCPMASAFVLGVCFGTANVPPLPRMPPAAHFLKNGLGRSISASTHRKQPLEPLAESRPGSWLNPWAGCDIKADGGIGGMGTPPPLVWDGWGHPSPRVWWRGPGDRFSTWRATLIHPFIHSLTHSLFFSLSLLLLLFVILFFIHYNSII